MSDRLAGLGPPHGMEPVTRAVSDSEPCFYLSEENRLAASSQTMCRYQILRVVRNDKLVTAYVNLGPASSFAADPLYIMGGQVDANGRGEAWHTVAELQEIAEHLRSEPVRRELEPWDAQADWRNHNEEQGRKARHLTTSGPGGQVVRE